MRATALGARSYVHPGHSESIGILLESDEARVLVECGPYAVSQLAEFSIPLDRLTAVFVSHDHADHAGGLPWLLFSNLMERFHGRIGPGSLDLLVPAGEPLAMVDYCRRVYPRLFTKGGPFEVSCVEVPCDGASARHRDMSLACKVLDHAVPNAAVRVEAGSRAFVFVSDSLQLSDIGEFAKDADLLVCSAAGSQARVAQSASSFKFLTAAEAGQLARSANARRLWLVHCFFDDDLEDCREEAARAFGGPVAMAARGDALEL